MTLSPLIAQQSRSPEPYQTTQPTFALTFSPTGPTQTGETHPSSPYKPPHSRQETVDFPGLQAALESGQVTVVNATQQSPKYVIFPDLIVAIGVQIAQGGSARVSKATVFSSAAEPYEAILKQSLRRGKGDTFGADREKLDEIFSADKICRVDAPLRTGVDSLGYSFSLNKLEHEDMARFSWGQLTSELRSVALIACFTNLSDLYAHIHEKGYVHGDIKPENQLLNETTALPTDWGTLRLANEEKPTSQCSISYADPLGFLNEEGAPAIQAQIDRRFFSSISTDIYAFGRSIEDTIFRVLSKAYKADEDLRQIGGMLVDVIGPMDYFVYAINLTNYYPPQNAGSSHRLLVRHDLGPRYDWYLRVIDAYVEDETEARLLKNMLHYALFECQNPEITERPSMREGCLFFTQLQEVIPHQS